MDGHVIMKRTPNFTTTESDLLISLVKQHKCIIECLKTGTVNAKMKKDAWQTIANEFNSQSAEHF